MEERRCGTANLVKRRGAIGLWVRSEGGLQKRSINVAIEYTVPVFIPAP